MRSVAEVQERLRVEPIEEQMATLKEMHPVALDDRGTGRADEIVIYSVDEARNDSAALAGPKTDSISSRHEFWMM